MIKTVFFDFDGVLVESVDIKTEAFAKLFEQEGRPVVEKVVQYHLQHAGVSRFEKFRYIYQEILRRPLAEKVFDELCGEFARLVVDAVVRAPYVKGAKEFLDKNRSKYKIYVVSATPQNEIEEIINRRGLNGCFDGIYGSPVKKIDAVRKVFDEEILKPDQSVYVGDALSDYEAARRNGVKFIARISGNESLFDNIECLKVADLAGLQSLIEKL